VTYSGYTDDLSADLGAFGGRLEPSNYRERSLGSVGVAPRAGSSQTWCRECVRPRRSGIPSAIPFGPRCASACRHCKSRFSFRHSGL